MLTALFKLWESAGGFSTLLVVALLAYVSALLRALLREIRMLEKRADEDRAAADARAKALEARAQEDRAAADARAKALEDRAQEDREKNDRDHERLFEAVSDLQGDVKVLLDRSGPGA